MKTTRMFNVQFAKDLSVGQIILSCFLNFFFLIQNMHKITEWISEGHKPFQISGARGDPPMPHASRGHPLLRTGPGVDWPQCFRARDHPEIQTGARGHPDLFKARDHPEPVNNIGINSSEEGLIISILACFLKPDGRGMSFYQGCRSRVPGTDSDRKDEQEIRNKK